MKSTLNSRAALIFTVVLACSMALGDVHYVSPDGAHVSPYTTWSRAATDIQSAIDMASDGDTVLVADGVYSSGWTMVWQDMRTRVAITNAITVRSQNGPQHTFIVGQGPLGDSAVRCAYAGVGAQLAGFTLTNGHTHTIDSSSYLLPLLRSGGGVRCEPSAVVSNCVIVGNAADYGGGGTFNGIILGCLVAGNSAHYGGGIYASDGMAGDCIISNNSAFYGGGMSGANARNCTITRNSATYGGGTRYGTIEDCTISDNSAYNDGGGATYSTVRNCIVSQNSAGRSGGGTHTCNLASSLIMRNSAANGGGTHSGTIRNCTITGNTGVNGAGTCGGTIWNCIVYYNYTGYEENNWDGSRYRYSCTRPDPGGPGNITNLPAILSVSNGHIVAESPCLGRGTNETWMTDATDIDGESRIIDGTVDIGCDEFWGPGATGALSVGIQWVRTNAMTGVELSFVADIEGRATGYEWTWGDGQANSNVCIISHSYESMGDYSVVLRAWNAGGSVSATVPVHIVAIYYTNFVSQTGSHTWPYTDWAMAATNIQSAIAVNTRTGGVVVVGDGVYDTGGSAVHGTMINRIAVTNPITVRSVNGPTRTFLVGQGPQGDTAVRCAYVGSNALLAGFTLTNGYTHSSGDYNEEQSGGGAWCEGAAAISNCTIVGNAAAGYGGGTYGGTVWDCAIAGNYAKYGGGTYGGTVRDCTITGNAAAGYGGGSYHGIVQNCSVSNNLADYGGGGMYGGAARNSTIAGNRAAYGGGTYGGMIRNSIVYYNSSATEGDNWYAGIFIHSCTTPGPLGRDNTSGAPGFVSPGTPHIVANSPCVDSGTLESWMATATDIDNEPRIANDRIDMGCDEYWASSKTGSLEVAIVQNCTNIMAGINLSFRAIIRGTPTGYGWQWGDGHSTSSVYAVGHSYAESGNYNVVLNAWNNDTNVSATVQIHVAPVFYTNFVSFTGDHTWPYTNWVTAATNIQAAIEANVLTGGLVLVDRGVYGTGTVTVHTNLLNRIAITNAITVRSVTGPASTILLGQGPLGTNAVRCAYVGANARLEGFTLTNGHTRTNGICDEDQSGGAAWCEPSGIISNCMILGSSAERDGGGTYGGTIYNCTISANTATYGGGTHSGNAWNCMIFSNTATYGGGSCSGAVQHCIIFSNTATYGGGSYSGTVQNCAVHDNTATYGGGTCRGTIRNCTITDNSAALYGGGTYYGYIENSIVYYNSSDNSGANRYAGTYSHSCTTPDPGGTANVTAAPSFVHYAAGNYSLRQGSPCINVGTNQSWMHDATDLADMPRIQKNIVDMGAYESALWRGDIHYVYPGGRHIAPYTNWFGAATDIQSAIAVASDDDTVLVYDGVYSSGWAVVYGETRNRIAVTKAITVASVNGPEYTVIVGQGPLGDTAIRCAYVGDDACLAGFTLTNGYTRISGDYQNEQAGGGVWCESGATVSNCTIVGCSASGHAGGTYYGTLKSCTVSGNSAGNNGGGTCYGTVQRCSISSNSAANNGGGTYYGTVQRCSISGNSAANNGGGTYHGTLEDCTISRNAAANNGGGTYYGTVQRCSISGNSAEYGGGTYYSAIDDCTISGNSAEYGGGTYDGTIQNCTISKNSANYGGGTYAGMIKNCTASGNAADYGGGTCYGTNRNCAIIGNSAADAGGGSYEATIENCTIAGNSANYGGGTYGSMIKNCIVYYNSASVAGNNSYGDIHTYSCTTPDPGGTGNITNAPGLLSLSNPHIVAGSTCIDKGMYESWMAAATDIDGEPRITNDTVDIGCDEFVSAGMTGAVRVSINLTYTSVAVGHGPRFEADIQGRASGYTWEFGDGQVSSNASVIDHIYSITGNYDVVLTVWNDSGTSSSSTRVHVTQPHTNFVARSGTHTAPYASWSTAATNIQAAISANRQIGGVVLVTNGTYDTGTATANGGMENRIAVTNPITVRSINGPVHTVIVGAGPLGDNAVRCAYVGHGAELVGFTLTNGHTRTAGNMLHEQAGGGVWCESDGMVSNCTIAGNVAAEYGGGTMSGTISDCVVAGNAAAYGGGASYGNLQGCTISRNSARFGGGSWYGTVDACVISSNTVDNAGGGSFYGTVKNCIIAGNSAEQYGGGIYAATVRNCTIVGNAAGSGGGAYHGTIHNSVVYYNSSAKLEDNWHEGTYTYSCTKPDPGGDGNITSTPRFADYAGDDYHLLSISPCIGAGTNQEWMTGASDLAGNARIADGTVDMGAYEFVVLPGTIHYVATNGLHFAPYTDPFHAATNIQHAIDAASAGQTVLVADGTYDAGWTVVQGQQIRNRIVVANGITVRSVNGPKHTFIVGQGPASDSAVRCAYVGSNSRLIGFTLMNGHTRTTGVTEYEQSGGGAMCESGAMVSNCIVRDNHAEGFGGGVFYGTIHSCTVAGNSAQLGGGTYGGDAWNCTIYTNVAVAYGGGAYASTIRGCVLFDNSAFSGGATYYGTIINCTILDNHAHRAAGGTYKGTVKNSIVYYNSAGMFGDNFSDGTYTYSCTSPYQAGTGNITNKPGFTDRARRDYQLVARSACANAGANETWMSTATDLAGKPRIMHAIVDMGAYESVALPAVTLYSPSLTVTTNRPSFLWAIMDYTSWYYLWVEKNGTAYESRWINATNTWTATQDMWGGKYRWWVRAWNDDGYGPWSTNASFTIPLKIPASTVLIAPAGTIITNRPRFTWKSADDATWYRLWVNRNTGPYWTKWVQDTNYVSDDSIPLGSYRWWAAAWNPDGYGPWSDPSDFAYGISTPSWPTGTITATNQPVFTWSVVPEASWYRLRLNSNGQFYANNWIAGTNTWAFTNDLPIANYRWWIQTWNSNGLGPWSAGATFILE